MTAIYSHRCSACGQCCTSAPLLTLPEVFHHQGRFLGALGIRKLRQAIPGIGVGRFFLSAQGLDHAGTDGCPARSPGGQCDVHDDRKPVACRVVPFDALAPDAAQAAVLDERLDDSDRWGSECIVRGPTPTLPVVVKRLRVVDGEAGDALALHRRLLSLEKRFWGSAVFRTLEPELLRHAPAVETLERGGIVTLSLAPVLAILASVSLATHRRCLDYIDAQLALSDAVLRQGRTPSDVAARVRAFARTNVALGRSLETRRPPSPPLPLLETAALEAWLGVSRSPKARAVVHG